MTTKEKDVYGGKVSKAAIELSGRMIELVKPTPTGILEPLTKDLYEQLLPDGWTMADVKELQVHNRHVVQATRITTAHFGIPLMVENPEIDQVSIEFDGGEDHFGETLHRKIDEPDGKGGVKTTYGHTVSYYEAGADSAKAALKAISAHTRNMASEAFGG